MLHAVEINLVLAWLWITVGFLTGFLMGLFFHREDWLGGYGSFKRRLFRLGHISFFGLGILNLLFYFTARQLALEDGLAVTASWGFAVGAVTMPACCFTVAHAPSLRALFLVPVLSLTAAGALVVWEVMGF